MKATFLKGVALGAVVSTVTVFSTAALAGTGVGGVFNLGKANTVNANTALTGSANAAQLKVSNANKGAGATGIAVNVAAGKPPLSVNSSTKITNLDADLLDGLDSTQLQKRVQGGCDGVGAIVDIDQNGNTSCTDDNEVPISLYVPTGESGQEVGIAAVGTLQLMFGCAAPGSWVEFRNLEGVATSLNWLYGNGSSVSASGVTIGVDGSYTVSFTNSRIEGQFIWAEPDSVSTINLHAVQLSTGCDIQGTANVVSTKTP